MPLGEDFEKLIGMLGKRARSWRFLEEAVENVFDAVKPDDEEWAASENKNKKRGVKKPAEYSVPSRMELRPADQTSTFNAFGSGAKRYRSGSAAAPSRSSGRSPSYQTTSSNAFGDGAKRPTSSPRSVRRSATRS